MAFTLSTIAQIATKTPIHHHNKLPLVALLGLRITYSRVLKGWNHLDFTDCIDAMDF